MDTSASLLDSLRAAPEEEAWRQLVEIYSPLIRNWLKRHGADLTDMDDVVQEVLVVVVRKIPEFRREPRAGAFRSWLRTITANCLHGHWKRQNRQPAAIGGSDFGQIINQLQDPHSGLSQQWEREHDQHVLTYLLQEIRGEVSESTWRAFQRFALDGLSADQTASELGMTPNAVFIAKSRVLSLLRQRGRGLID